MNTADILALAHTLDQARRMANAIPKAAPMDGVYGDIGTALKNTLFLVVPNRSRVERIYGSLLDGNAVAQAVAWEKADWDATTDEIMGLL